MLSSRCAFARLLKQWCFVCGACSILWPVGLQAQGPGSNGALQADARIGVSFADIGTTFAASGVGRVFIADSVSISGELGWLPHAAFEDADEVRLHLRPVAPDAEPHVNAYHLNGNVEISRLVADRLIPYATAGIGAFFAETVATGDLGTTQVRTRRSATDFATNFGGGVTYMLTPQVGVNADYRLFYVNREDETVNVQRFVVGLGFPLR